jgi:hypothetical protein
MPRILRVPKARRMTTITDSMRAWLLDESDGSGDLDIFLLEGDKGRLREVVEPMLPEIVELFAANHPGERPSIWWRMRGDLRARLGGKGRTMPDVYSAYRPRYEYGVPSDWESIDNADSPTFESQAAFLKRRNLLLPGEAKRLRAADYAPERIGDEHRENLLERGE